MAAAENVAAVGEVQVRDEAVLGVDPIRKALDGFAVTLVDVGERVAADTASIDEVEWRNSFAGRHGD